MGRLGAALLSILMVAVLDLAVRNAECGVGCRRGGWDNGAYRALERDCYCVDYVDFFKITGKRLQIGKRPAVNAPEEKPAQAAPQTSSSWPWSF